MISKGCSSNKKSTLGLQGIRSPFYNFWRSCPALSNSGFSWIFIFFYETSVPETSSFHVRVIMVRKVCRDAWSSNDGDFRFQPCQNDGDSARMTEGWHVWNSTCSTWQLWTSEITMTRVLYFPGSGWLLICSISRLLRKPSDRVSSSFTRPTAWQGYWMCQDIRSG